MYFWIIILAFLSTILAVYQSRLTSKEITMALFIQLLLFNITLIGLLGVGTIDQSISIKFLIIYSVLDLLIAYLSAVFLSKYQLSWKALKTIYAKIWIALTPIFCFVLMERIFADSHLWRPSGPYYPARPGHLRPLTVMPRKALYMSST